MRVQHLVIQPSMPLQVFQNYTNIPKIIEQRLNNQNLTLGPFVSGLLRVANFLCPRVKILDEFCQIKTTLTDLLADG